MNKTTTPILLGLFTAACSAIGDPGGYPSGYPHGGTGVFRALTGEETGILDGRAIVTQRVAVEAPNVAEGHLFYATAPALEERPEVPEGHPRNEVFWPAFGARSIFRAAPRANPGFAAGQEVLRAELPWEGGEVFDPWVVVHESGVRLFYAAEGGIGLAEASTVDGAFRRVGNGPILGASAALEGAPRRPSVVRGPQGAFWMYYDAGGAIGAARSDDGVTFTRVDGDPSTPAIDPIVLRFDDPDFEDVRTSRELSVGAPGAASVETPAGRRIVRLYFESRRDDGAILAYVAGTSDGVTFDRHNVPVLSQDDVRFPAPFVLDRRVTLLYANVPFVTGGLQTRSIVASVSPAAESFAPPDAN